MIWKKFVVMMLYYNDNSFGKVGYIFIILGMSLNWEFWKVLFLLVNWLRSDFGWIGLLVMKYIIRL